MDIALNAVPEPASSSSRVHRAVVAGLVGLVRGYQRFLSPALPVVTLGACACRFSPSCSQYAIDALRTHGVLAGLALALRRLLRCTPLHPGGFDPVPPRTRGPRPFCTRTS